MANASPWFGYPRAAARRLVWADQNATFRLTSPVRLQRRVRLEKPDPRNGRVDAGWSGWYFSEMGDYTSYTYTHTLDYEQLIADQEGEPRRLLEVSGLERHDACLRFFEPNRTVATPGFDQVRRPMYALSVQRHD